MIKLVNDPKINESLIRALLVSFNIDPKSLDEEQLREFPEPKIRKTIGIKPFVVGKNDKTNL